MNWRVKDMATLNEQTRGFSLVKEVSSTTQPARGASASPPASSMASCARGRASSRPTCSSIWRTPATIRSEAHVGEGSRHDGGDRPVPAR
jgi:hypothetical protein